MVEKVTVFWRRSKRRRRISRCIYCLAHSSRIRLAAKMMKTEISSLSDNKWFFAIPSDFIQVAKEGLTVSQVTDRMTRARGHLSFWQIWPFFALPTNPNRLKNGQRRRQRHFHSSHFGQSISKAVTFRMLLRCCHVQLAYRQQARTLLHLTCRTCGTRSKGPRS